MSDRFPYFVVAIVLATAAIGTFALQGAQRGEFADRYSTYRSTKDGTRALYLLLTRNQLKVQRLEQPIDVATADVNLALLGVTVAGSRDDDFLTADAGFPSLFSPAPSASKTESDDDESDSPANRNGLNALKAAEVDKEEVTLLLKHAQSGHRVLYVPSSSKENELSRALEIELRKPPKNAGLRTLVPAQPSPYTIGVESLEAKVSAFLDLPKSARPILVDQKLDEVIAAAVPYGQGEVVIVAAPELATNQALARADNAMFWLSVGRALSRERALAFDEFHHGFTGERSVGDFARRYGLQYALAQLLLGLLFWSLSLKTFGKPAPPEQDNRNASVDALLSTSRLYQEGGHHQHAAALLVTGLASAISQHLNLASNASVDEVVTALRAVGDEKQADELMTLSSLGSNARSEHDVVALAQRAVRLRRIAQTSRTSLAHENAST